MMRKYCVFLWVGMAGLLSACGGSDGGNAPGPQAGSTPPMSRPPASYDVSRIGKVAGFDLASYDGRRAELFQNPAYQCGLPNVEGRPDTRGVHEFALLYPVGYNPDNPRPFVLYMELRGAGLGWIDLDGRYSGQPGHYMGSSSVATADWNRNFNMMGFINDRPFVVGDGGSELMSRLRAAHPDWAFIIPSFCSHDGYNGVGAGVDFPRYGWVAMVSAIQYVRDRFGITHMFAEGGSSGAAGVYFLARDLAQALPGVELRGVVTNSLAVEPGPFAALLDGNDTLLLPDPRGGTVQVPCQVDWEPTAVAFQRAGIANSETADIRGGLLDAPIYHLWGKREQLFCQDENYGDMFLDGPVARAIVDVNPLGRSQNREVCEENPEFALPCARHEELGGYLDEEPNGRNPDVVADVKAWIEQLDANFDSFRTSPGPN